MNKYAMIVDHYSPCKVIVKCIDHGLTMIIPPVVWTALKVVLGYGIQLGVCVLQIPGNIYGHVWEEAENQSIDSLLERKGFACPPQQADAIDKVKTIDKACYFFSSTTVDWALASDVYSHSHG